MKKILSLLVLAFACLSAHADFTTITLTVTNTPTNGYTATINGKVITWTNTVFTTANQVANTNSIGAATTNLLYQLVASPPTGVRASPNGTNAIDLLCFSALTVTVSTNWATLSTTNVVTTNGLPVLSRFSQYTLPATRTNVASGLVSDLDTYSTTAFSATSPTLANYAALSTAQTITGAKNFTGANVFSNSAQRIVNGYSTNLGIVNAPIISGSVDVLYGGSYSAPTLINAVNTGDPIRSPGTGINSEQFGNGTEASGDYSSAFGNSAIASGNRGVAIGSATAASGSISTAVGYLATANSQSSSAFGIASMVASGFDYSSAFGQNATATASNQVRIGTSSESVSIPGNLQVGGSVSNTIFAGSVTLNNELLITAFNNTSLATNNSAVNISTNSYVTIASGPSAGFAIHGIAGGVSGRMVTIENTTGYSMTLVDSSGVDPTAGNRLKIGTGSGSNYLNTNNPGTVTLRYNGTLTSWILVSHN